MENYINNIISQENIQISQLNDEELAQFSEICFNIISQFLEITIEDFMIQFHNVIQNLIEKQEREFEIQEQKNQENFYNTYYKHLDDMEKEHYRQIEQIQQMKHELASLRVKVLMTKPQPDQRSQAWYDMRYNMLTASDVGSIIGYSKYNDAKSVVLKKCGHSSFKGNKFTLHGQKYEPVATSIYESRYNTDVIEFGLIQHEKIPFIGASPDGITPDGIMVEIKCPYTRKLNGDIWDPKTKGYLAQIYTQLEVCDLYICDFWECEFAIYDNYRTLDEYLEDVYQPGSIETLDIIPPKPSDHVKVPFDRRSSNGLEKGMIVKVRKPNSNEDEYLYPPFNVTTQDQINWIEKQDQSQYDIFEILYWKLKKTSICRVHRDKQWWRDQMPKLQKCWDEIQVRRVKGCQDILPKSRSSMSNLKKSKPNNVLDLSNFFSKDKKQKPKTPPKKKSDKKSNFAFTNLSDSE